MSEVEELQRYPAWRGAVQAFLQEFKEGDVVPHSWLSIYFGLADIPEDLFMSRQQHLERQFAWLASIEGFKQELLQEHSILLWSVRGEGYRWVPPHEQTRTAMDALVKDARKVFAAAGQRLQRLRLDALDDAQRREHVDATSKLASLRQMARRALK